jgi:hypothetical protein
MAKFIMYIAFLFTLAVASFHLHYGSYGYALFNGGLSLWLIMLEHKTRD